MVKILCLLLSLLVSLLSVWPCCTQDACSDEEGTSISYTESCSAEPQHEADKSCSPFLACGSCTGFMPAANSPVMQQPLLVSAATCIGPVQEKNPVRAASPIWQPPKLG